MASGSNTEPIVSRCCGCRGKLLAGEEMDEEESDGSWRSSDDELDPEMFALHDAAELGNLDAIRSAIEHHKPPVLEPSADQEAAEQPVVAAEALSERDPIWAMSPLHTALVHRQLGALKLLVESGVPTDRSCEGIKPIHMATMMAGYECSAEFGEEALTTLLAHGAETDCTDDRGRTALHIASELGALPLIKKILDAAGEQAGELVATKDKAGDLLMLH